MSEETKETGSTPAKTESAAAEAPAGPEPGEFGRRLQQAGIPLTPLVPDAWGNETIELSREDALRAAVFLRDDCRFDLALSCTGVDWKDHRESVYHLYSLDTKKYLVLKIKADANDHSPSLMPVWPAVDWHERESYDLVGIAYDGHVNLKRILMPIDWLGHPLRKDYKVDDPRLVWNQR